MEGRNGRNRGPFRSEKRPRPTTPSAPTKTKREEAIEHSYRKMMRKETSRTIASHHNQTQTRQIQRPDGEAIPPSLTHDRDRRPQPSRYAPGRKPTYQDRNKGNKRPWKSVSPNFDKVRGSTKRMLPSRNNESEDKIEIASDQDDGNEGAQNQTNKKRKLSQMQRAQRDMEMKKQESRRKEFERKKFEEERAAALKERKEMRMHRNKFLNQKNAKGQPLFKGQIQMILDKLQSQSSKN